MLRIAGYSRTWEVEDVQGLHQALAWRDARGGGIFFLSRENVQYPHLCIRVSGNIADVHFFPEEGHPGYRCLGDEGMPEGESTTFVYEGCDPWDGEETPNRFVVPFETARSIATAFLRSERRPDTVSWFEL